MKKLRNEQKGILFIALIVIVIIALSLFFARSLKTNSVEDALEHDTLLRTLFVVQNDDGTELFSNVIILDTSTKKAAVINLPGYTGAIFQSLGRTDRLAQVYNELGMASYRTEVQKNAWHFYSIYNNGKARRFYPFVRHVWWNARIYSISNRQRFRRRRAMAASFWCRYS